MSACVQELLTSILLFIFKRDCVGDCCCWSYRISCCRSCYKCLQGEGNALISHTVLPNWYPAAIAIKRTHVSTCISSETKRETDPQCGCLRQAQMQYRKVLNKHSCLNKCAPALSDVPQPDAIHSSKQVKMG